MCEVAKGYEGKRTTVIAVWKIFRLQPGFGVDLLLTSPYDWHGRGKDGYAIGKWHRAESPVEDPDTSGEFHAWSTKTLACDEFRRNPAFFKDCIVRKVRFRKVIGRDRVVTAREMYIPK